MPDKTFDTGLARLFRASRYAERVMARDPGLLDWLRENAMRPAVVTVAAMDALHSEQTTAFDTLLRRHRQRAMLAILYRDLNGMADLHEVVSAISAFADLTIAAARQHHTAALLREWGVNPSSMSDLIVVGMGKLGGFELNVSSDIDLIFIHRADGEANADKSWHEFHSQLGRRIIRSLDQIDENGQVFRVDMRLRPFGDSGPLVTSLATLESYFLKYARPWERYAWLKARAVTGETDTVAALDRLVQPFVYRHYHDYAAIDEMRALHAQIRADALKRGKHNDIKVGEGGIREVEFVTQIHQLIRGGRGSLAGQTINHSGLQTRSTRDALNELAARELMPAERVQSLQLAYAFLRNLEHRLQYLDDQQTQSLPSNATDEARIAESMGFADWPTFMVALDAHRGLVKAEFGSVFGEVGLRSGSGSSIAPAPANPNESGSTDLQPSISTGVSSQNSPESPTNRGLFLSEAQEEINERVTRWRASSRMQGLSPKLRSRLETLIERALVVCAVEDPSTTTLFRVFALLDAIDKRETYLALLVEYPEVLGRVARIAHQSAWAALQLQRHPILLDDLLTSMTPEARVNDAPLIDWAAKRRDLEQSCDASPGDVERQYEILRHTKQRITLKLNVADIEGRVGVMALSDELSQLADLLVNAVMVLAWRALNPGDAANWQAPPGFAVVGYGKWGSKELGYASDLDLVFIYDPAAGLTPEQVGRLAQRINSWLNTMTAGGVLYDTDLRLRPDGASGLLVSSLVAFRDYQLTRAWTWEHQALTRARWCAGDRGLLSPFDAIRRDVLAKVRDQAALQREILDMRDKMRAEKKDRGESLDLKNTMGGIIDIEFIVQYLILAYSPQHPELLNNLGNFALITRAAALGIIDEEQAAKVAKAYLAFRHRLHAAQNNNERKAWIAVDELERERFAVTMLWKSVFAGPTAAKPV